ncbi:MAG: UDP-N-acetylglucosamine--N-acetylmuramyl-(pentapeptide) pyrophosphoryl-undecaprenol N-acetylglucosamine transferase [Kiritimatiellia bacterium]
MTDKKKCYVVACGGTGGHIFPGLAVARVLRRRGHRVSIWLAGRDIENAAAKGWDGDKMATGAPRLSLKSLPFFPRSFSRCLRGFNHLKPDALLAMGSYTSLPPVLAARMSHIPVFLHEANAVPGKAVDFLSRFAECTAVSFRETGNWLQGREVCFTGLPVRNDLIGQTPFEDVPDDAFVIFVTGGSQGARRLNQLASQAAALLRRDGAENFFVIHQSGKADEQQLREFYHKEGVPAKVSAFIDDMGKAYAAADIVVARAGASTCFELSLLGKPAFLVPLPSAVRNHQHHNAFSLVKAGGADEGIQSELTARSLMRYLFVKMNNPFQLVHMGQAVKVLAVPDAAERLADEVEKA